MSKFIEFTTNGGIMGNEPDKPGIKRHSIAKSEIVGISDEDDNRTRVRLKNGSGYLAEESPDSIRAQMIDP